MEIKNPIYTANGNINCEINHPKHGWIPTTASPDDPHTADVFAAAEALGPAAYVPPPPPTIEEQRAVMRCSPVQMRIALKRAGLLDQVQAIADADAEASIVWEYATQIVRNSPLIDALGGENGFTPEEIDNLFTAAMAVEV